MQLHVSSLDGTPSYGDITAKIKRMPLIPAALFLFSSYSVLIFIFFFSFN
ncbi:hypothetical protein KP77_22690 [Jeotgalibacillus alimentarius]|uniref:Uncharacterized protein n=1 Tax=Jeotgalibacillus alimentarius TaxID=135826 RepID=A0A0C2VIC6_9BACL|nr:hypothetical protein KP77_22690 [Jeotgalibacillus alimentarius]